MHREREEQTFFFFLISFAILQTLGNPVEVMVVVTATAIMMAACRHQQSKEWQPFSLFSLEIDSEGGVKVQMYTLSISISPYFLAPDMTQ